MANLYQRLMMQHLTPHDVARGAFTTSGFTPPRVAKGNAQAMLNRAWVARGIVDGPHEFKYVLGGDTTGMAGLSGVYGFGALSGGGRVNVFGPFEFSNYLTGDAWQAWAKANISDVLDQASFNSTALFQAMQGGNQDAAKHFNLLASDVQRAQQDADVAQGKLEDAKQVPDVFYVGGVAFPNPARQAGIDQFTLDRTRAFVTLGKLAQRAADIVVAKPKDIQTEDLPDIDIPKGGGSSTDMAKINQYYKDVTARAKQDVATSRTRAEFEDAEERLRAVKAAAKAATKGGAMSMLPLIIGGLALGGLALYFVKGRKG